MQEKFAEQESKPKKKLHPEEKTLESWQKLCSPTAIEWDIHQYLKDEMELRYKSEPEYVIKLQKMLCYLIGYVATEGLPPITGTRPPFLDELHLNRNAETALLAAHSACARATGECSSVDWGKDPLAANSWLKRLSISPGRRFINNCLDHIQWQNNSFEGYSLDGANLSGAKIYGHSIYPESLGYYGGKNLWWLILSEDIQNHRVLLLALDAVTYREYHQEFVAITWKECDLRKWLNSIFLEDMMFHDTTDRFCSAPLHTNDNPKYKTSGGADTEDKLFLLSIDEVKEYFPNDDDHIARLNGEPVWWWLRSPGFSSYYAAIVYYVGYVYDIGDIVSSSGGAVRPAFWLNLKS
jgi:hypothetical protein